MTPESWGQRVAGKCPSCGAAPLFVGEGGYVTCGVLSCPNPCDADVDALVAAVAVERKRADRAEAQRDDAYSTVSRVWDALGNPTLENLRGLTIWERVARAVAAEARADTLAKALREIKPLVTGQLPTPIAYEMTMRCAHIADVIDAALAAADTGTPPPDEEEGT